MIRDNTIGLIELHIIGLIQNQTLLIISTSFLYNCMSISQAIADI